MVKVFWFVSAMIVAAVAQAWPPGPEYPQPPEIDGQQVYLHDQLMGDIRNRLGDLLTQLQQGTEDATLSPQGDFLLDSDHFAQLDSSPVLTQGRLWNSEAGVYDRPFELQFETRPLVRSNNLGNAEIADIDNWLGHWQELAFEHEEAFSEEAYEQLRNIYRGMRGWLKTGGYAPQGSRGFLTVASYIPQGAEHAIPVAVSITSVSPVSHAGTLEYVAVNPEAQLPRSVRPGNAVGSSGSALMDYEFRRLRNIENMQEIRLEALNNRVGVFAHSRGFRYQCDS